MKPNQNLDHPEKEKTPNERAKEAFDLLVNFKEKNGELMQYGPYVMAYNHAHREGLIEITDAIRKEYRTKAEESFKRQKAEANGDKHKIKLLTDYCDLTGTMKELFMRDWINFNY